MTGTERPLPDEYRKRQEEIAGRVEALRRKIAEDPYAMLFGRRLQRGVWNPWTSFETEKPPKSRDQRRHNETSSLVNGGLEGDVKGTVKVKPVPLSEEATLKHAPILGEAPSVVRETEPQVIFDVEEYDIDPISNRKVPRKRPDIVPTSTVTPQSSKQTRQEGSLQLIEKDDESSLSKHARRLSSSIADGKATPIFPPLSGFAKFWLAKEGFGTQNEQSDNVISTSVHEDKTSFDLPRSNCKKIESSLDRHIRNQDGAESTGTPKRLPLVHKSNKNIENTDLLKASEIRASCGLANSPTEQIEEEKLKRRKRLEEDFIAQERDSDLQHVKSIAAYRETVSRLHQPSRSDDTKTRGSNLPEEINKNKSNHQTSLAAKTNLETHVSSQNLENSDSIRLENETQTQENHSYAAMMGQLESTSEKSDINALRKDLERQILRLEEQHAKELLFMRKEQEKLAQQEIEGIQRRKEEMRKAAEIALAKEISAQKAAMEATETRRDRFSINTNSSSIQLGEGDMSANVHEFASRDRWYKKKAPHTIDRELQAQSKSHEQRARDLALVREIRGIYEDSYGTIDTKHRQLECANVNYKESSAVDKQVQGKVRPSGESPDSMSKKLPIHLKERTKPHLSSVGETRQEVDFEDSSHLKSKTSKDAEPHKDHATKKASEDTCANGQNARGALTDRGNSIQPPLTAEWTDEISQQVGPYQPGGRTPSPYPPEFLQEMLEIRRTLLESLEAQRQVHRNLRVVLKLFKTDRSLLQDLHARIKQSEEIYEKFSRAAKSEAALDHVKSLPKNLVESDRKESKDLLATKQSSTTLYPRTSTEECTYKILALDHGDQEVTSANTISSVFETSSPRRGIAEILSRLLNPAKFIPHLESLEGTGFELVAGNRRMLVYKMVHDRTEKEQGSRERKSQLDINGLESVSSSGKPKYISSHTIPDTDPTMQTATNPSTDSVGYEIDTSQTGLPKETEHLNVSETVEKFPDNNNDREKDSPHRKHLINPVDGTTSRFASPTGFVNHDAVFPLSTIRSPAGKVRREEAVFSGSSRSRWSEEKSASSSSSQMEKKPQVDQADPKEFRRSGKVFRELKRLFWTASFIAVFCYTLGLYQEWRTTRPREAERRSRG